MAALTMPRGLHNEHIEQVIWYIDIYSIYSLGGRLQSYEGITDKILLFTLLLATAVTSMLVI